VAGLSRTGTNDQRPGPAPIPCTLCLPLYRLPRAQVVRGALWTGARLISRNRWSPSCTSHTVYYNRCNIPYLCTASHVRRSFVEAVDRRAAQKQERLEAELHGYKTNLIKESIRMGHNDLGDFFYDRGDLQVCE
jgi:hypothetical protein